MLSGGCPGTLITLILLIGFCNFEGFGKMNTLIKF